MPVCKTTLSHLQFSKDTDALLIIRSSSDEPWDEKKEDAACKSHDGVYGFLADCVTNKVAVYALIKSLKEKVYERIV